MKLRYKAILIDHDDTAVDSTPHIHHPAHQEQMRRLDRVKETLNLEEWFKINYSPGLRPYYDTILKLTAEEEQRCYEIWREFTTAKNPPFFPGMMDLLQRVRDLGGKIIVVSHSEPDIIARHYTHQQDLPGFEPDLIIGWTGKREQNKPYPWPVEEVERQFGLPREEMLMIDDLKPGLIMAQQAGIASFGVGWSHRIPEIQRDIQQAADYFGTSLEDLEQVLFCS